MELRHFQVFTHPPQVVVLLLALLKEFALKAVQGFDSAERSLGGLGGSLGLGVGVLLQKDSASIVFDS